MSDVRIYGYDKKSSASVTTLILNHKQLKVQPVDDLKMISNPAYSNVAATTEDQDQPIYEPVDPVDKEYTKPIVSPSDGKAKRSTDGVYAKLETDACASLSKEQFHTKTPGELSFHYRQFCLLVIMKQKRVGTKICCYALIVTSIARNLFG